MSRCEHRHFMPGRRAVIRRCFRAAKHTGEHWFKGWPIHDCPDDCPFQPDYKLEDVRATAIAAAYEAASPEKGEPEP